MARKKTDFRALKARRDSALARTELRRPETRPTLDSAEVEAAIAAGKITRLPMKGRGR